MGDIGFGHGSDYSACRISYSLFRSYASDACCYSNGQDYNEETYRD